MLILLLSDLGKNQEKGSQDLGDLNPGVDSERSQGGPVGPNQNQEKGSQAAVYQVGKIDLESLRNMEKDLEGEISSLKLQSKRSFYWGPEAP
jgi:hypothetical protein